MKPTRRAILADVLAGLEAERFTPGPTKPRTTPRPHYEPVTPEQAADNLAALEDALSDDPTVVEWRERRSA